MSGSEGSDDSGSVPRPNSSGVAGLLEIRSGLLVLSERPW